MAKVVCKNCGTKNPSSAASCSNCGSFLVDDAYQKPSQPDTFTQPPAPVETEEAGGQDTQSAEPVETKPYEGPVETVKVPGGNSVQWISMVSTVGILAVFLGMEYLKVPLPSYSIYIFLVLIFVVPTLIRRTSTPIKFSPVGFTIPNTPEVPPVSYENIMNVRLGAYSRYEQSVTLFFKDSEKPLKLNFNSMVNFRSLIVTLNRRRVPIVRDNPGQNAGQQTAS